MYPSTLEVQRAWDQRNFSGSTHPRRDGLYAFHHARAIQINGFCTHAQLLRDFLGGVTLQQPDAPYPTQVLDAV
jgi:hypothetical protein